MARSWFWIKRLQGDALDFRGPEREIIRSVALMTLGGFNLVLSVLPPSLKRAASFLSGFDGDRDGGLEMMMTCWREGGLLAPWAAISWVHYQVDTKTFLGEAQTPADFARCEEIVAWARTRYEGSPFFAAVEADLAAAQRDVPRASAVCAAARPRASGLHALAWVFAWKQALYHLTAMEWAEAGAQFRASLAVYEKVGRRSMVPYVAMQAATCFLTAADAAAADTAGVLQAQAAAMLGLVARYHAADKGNWGRQD